MTGFSGSAHTPASGQGESTTWPRAAVVEHHLRRLGTDDLAALVADLWASRGYETSRKKELVVATRGKEVVNVAVVGRRRLGTPSLPDCPVDVVVAPGGPPAESAAGEYRMLDADELREMLFYAVDRSTSRQLCRRHLGASPEQLRPPLPTRLRNRSRTAASRVTPAVVLALLILVGLGAVAGVAFTLGTAEQHEPPAPTRADADTAAAPGGANRSTVAPPYSVLTTDSAGALESDESETLGFAGTLRSPPGVTRQGIANLTALASAHERVVAGRSYTLRLERVRPVKPLWEQDRREIEIAVAGDRYLLSERRVLPDGRLPIREVYYNGSAWHVVGFDGNSTIETVRQIQAGSAPEGPEPDPFELQGTLVSRYLSTAETDVTDRAPQRNRTLTRVVATGAPPGVGGETVRNYTAVALVDDRGLVRNLTVEYTPGTGPLNYTIRFEARYEDLGETTVRAPRWHGRALPDVRGPTRVGGPELPGAESSR